MITNTPQNKNKILVADSLELEGLEVSDYHLNLRHQIISTLNTLLTLE